MFCQFINSRCQLRVLVLYCWIAWLSLSCSYAADGNSSVSTGSLSTVKQRLFQEHVSRGLEFYRQEQWNDAIIEYRFAYEISSNSVLIFNIAQAYRKAGNNSESAILFEHFVRIDPNNVLVPEAKAFAAAAWAKVETARAQTAREAAEYVAEQRMREAEQLAVLNEDMLKRINDALRHGGHMTEKQVPIYRRVWFWTTIGGGSAVALGVSLGLGLGLHRSIPDAGLESRVVHF